MDFVATLTINPAVDLSTSVAEVTPAHKMRCGTGRRDPGGGGINVARVISRLGGRVTALFPAGGMGGQLLCEQLDRENVPRCTVNIAGETREDFTILEANSGKDYRFVLPGPVVQEPEWRACLRLIEELPEKPELIVASGSLPPGVPDDFYARVAMLAKKIGAKLALDTSGTALAAALQEGVYLVKPSLRELEELTRDSFADGEAMVRACAVLIKSGQAENVTLTLGEGGALLTTASGSYSAPALPVKPVSAVGAGDSFFGCMVWSLAQGMGLVEAFRYGMAGGTAAVLNPGTELCHAEDVRRLFGKICISQLS